MGHLSTSRGRARAGAPVGALVMVLAALVGCACGSGHARAPRRGGGGIEPSPSGSTVPARATIADDEQHVVHDEAQHLDWLADANLASDPAMRAALGVSEVGADGTMTYARALAWIAALNAYDSGAGYLGHHDWQLPTTPPDDPTCAIASGHSGNSFGPGCTGSALGGLFHMLLSGTYPDGLPPAHVTLGPFRDLPQGLFWTAGPHVAEPTPWGSESAFTFTFTSGARGRNTTHANYFYVMPVVRGPIGAPPSGTGLAPYVAGPAAGLALYDRANGLTWPNDAALAATSHFGVDGTGELHFPTGTRLTLPLVTSGGMMRFETAHDWLEGMNAARYAGASTWTLPTVDELRGLRDQLGLERTPEALLATDDHAGFHHFQRFFYWACQREQGAPPNAPCSGASPGPRPDGAGQMQWAFDFQTGFQGTDEEDKRFFVLPCRPAP